MSEFLVQMLDLLSRYIHIAASTILVGGTLFYEWVMPAAIDELKREHQLDVFGRARWFFKNLVWISAVLLLLSGIVTTKKYWNDYEAPETTVWRTPPVDGTLGAVQRPGWWWAAHSSTGLIAVIIALYLTTTRRPPEHPVGWMRINLVILLIVMFLASATAHMRQVAQDIAREDVRVPFVR